jgi:hypothetical protein
MLVRFFFVSFVLLVVYKVELATYCLGMDSNSIHLGYAQQRQLRQERNRRLPKHGNRL